MEIKNLSHLHPNDLFSAFQDAFRDYERQWSRVEFEKMLFRRGYVPELSFGAFDGEALVSFTLNGIGQWQGKKTAYDTGTGTLPEYRGQGLATQVFEESIPYFKKAAIEQYLLEVLQHNSKAISVYKQLGFQTSREFNYFSTETTKVSLLSKPLASGYTIEEIELDPGTMMPMWDFSPSWQNSMDALSRKIDDFKIAGAFHGSDLIGYGIIEPLSGDIPQIAIQKEHRRRGIGTSILRELLHLNQSNVVKLINADSSDDGIVLFLAMNNIEVKGKQFEMVREMVKL